jgi:endoglycosylceramidase
LAAKYNIRVFLDAHQDVFSRFFCGEGVPDWAVSDK